MTISATRTGTTASPTAYEGYCTDVFFDNALRFIEERQAEDPEPVSSSILATNAPARDRSWSTSRISKPYADKGIPQSDGQVSNGMIENIDDNMGRLAAKTGRAWHREQHPC